MTEEVKALIDVDHGGLLRRQPQPQRGEHGRHFLPQSLGVMTVTEYHQDEIVTVANEPPDTLAFPSAFGPLIRISL
ncbi:hypothetical protein ACFY1B_45335 [Streptomyces mirabilis]|uniref:hypothetical protein n=1 Tax=Streptomyces mirabilis TaxID=68239 RepID=UPI0036C3F9A0